MATSGGFWVAVGAKAEQALRESEERYRTIIDSIQEGYYEFDKKGCFTFLNDPICGIWGYGKEELLGMNYRNYTDAKNAAKAYSFFSKVYREGKSSDLVDFDIIRKNGDIRSLEFSASLVREPESGESVFYGIVRDVTRRKLEEEELRMAHKQAEEATRAKSDFLARMSHEIRTPMSSVLGFIDLVLEDPALKRKNRNDLITAKESAASLLSLLNEILDLSKIESGKLTLEIKPFSLRYVIESVMNASIIKAHEKGLKLEFDLKKNIPDIVSGDPAKLRQVLINLVDNAIKFTHKGGVDIHVIQKDGDRIQFSVNDTGIGIAKDRLEKIFLPFEQEDGSTTRRFGGTGLGTTISRHLVELMGGDIWIESKPGIGSAFHFTVRLPETDQTPENDLFGIHDTPIVKPKRLFRVLLVEDTPANVNLAVVRLKKQGHNVVHAWNGREAVEKFSDNAFDIILMDAYMPEMDGLEATKRIRSMSGGDLPIIALTASIAKDDRKKYIDAGMDEVAGKPVDFGRLFSLMEEIVPEGRGKPAGDHPAQVFKVKDRLPAICGVDVDEMNLDN